MTNICLSVLVRRIWDLLLGSDTDESPWGAKLDMIDSATQPLTRAKERYARGQDLEGKPLPGLEAQGGHKSFSG